jgi:hypothetical protein
MKIAVKKILKYIILIILTGAMLTFLSSSCGIFDQSTNDRTYSKNEDCSWSFLRYEPSALEEKWMQIVQSNPKAKGMCKDIHSPTHSAVTYELARATLDFSLKKNPQESTFVYFSKMIYKQQCKDGSSKVHSIV